MSVWHMCVCFRHRGMYACVRGGYSTVYVSVRVRVFVYG
jgi:hypothetical protein